MVTEVIIRRTRVFAISVKGDECSGKPGLPGALRLHMTRHMRDISCGLDSSGSLRISKSSRAKSRRRLTRFALDSPFLRITRIAFNG
jgi:hypothetical protein